MKKTTLFFLDIIVLYGSLLIALFLRRGEFNGSFGQWISLHTAPFSIIFAVWLMAFYIANLYDPRSFRNSALFFSDFFGAIATASGISVIFFYLIPIFGITPKTNLFLFILIFTLLESVNRFLFNRISERKFKKSIIIVGTGLQALELAKFIEENPQLGYELRRVIDTERVGAEELKRFIADAQIQVAVIGPEAYREPEIINIFFGALERKITFYGLASFFERLTGRVPLGAIDQVWFLENLNEGNKKTYDLGKRISDIIFTTAFGAVSLIFYPLIILAVKLDSPGPVFYRQKRVGRLGKIFKIIKFRTMHQDAEKGTGAIWAADNDPRITKVGRFLRKTRIDELPQLWNIFKGEMSLVGPRAERPEFHAILKKEVPFYEERYLIKPGLSGWAQINFHYGSSIQDAAEKLQYDLYYIKNRSLILDAGIALKTARIALQQSGK